MEQKMKQVNFYVECTTSIWQENMRSSDDCDENLVDVSQ